MRRRAGALVTLAMLGLGTLLAVDFRERTTPSPLPQGPVTAAIVFTGGAERVEDGLALWRGGAVAQLFITGVNSHAGLHAHRFAARFALSQAEQAALQEGRITLADTAHDTIENALESRCWQDHAHPGGLDAVVLITAPGHMPRASVALERMLGNVTVLRQPTSADQRSGHQRWSREFPRYLVTRALMALPERWLWARSDLWCDRGVTRIR